jgi:DNA-binding transcriptional regulator YdaS (Cro superfamily)
MEPDVITRLKHCGLSQAEIARALAVSDAAVSQWCSGRRQLSPEHRTELWELAILAEARIAAGGEGREALSDWTPTVLASPAGVSHVGTVELPPDLADTLQQLATRGELDMRAHHAITVQAALRELSAYQGRDPATWTASEVSRLRRVAKALYLIVSDMAEQRARQGRKEAQR